jgi:hypothetical protein
MRLRGVARNAVSPCNLPVHASDEFLGFQRFGVTFQHGKLAQTGLETLGDRDLADQAAKDELRRGVKPLRGQSVYHVVQGAGLDLIELLRRRGAALAGNHWHNREIRIGASRHDAGSLSPPPPNRENSPLKALKWLTTSNYLGRSAG